MPELVPAQRQRLARVQRDHRPPAGTGTADESGFTEGVAGAEEGDDDELAPRQRYPHADVTGGDQVERVCRVALMKDHLIPAVGPPSQRGDQPVPVFGGHRRENRPVHGSLSRGRPAGAQQGSGLTAKPAELARRPAPPRPLLAAVAPATLSIDHATTHPSTANHLLAGLCALLPNRVAAV